MKPTQKVLDPTAKKQVVLVNNKEIEINEVRISIFLDYSSFKFKIIIGFLNTISKHGI